MASQPTSLAVESAFAKIVAGFGKRTKVPTSHDRNSARLATLEAKLTTARGPHLLDKRAGRFVPPPQLTASEKVELGLLRQVST